VIRLTRVEACEANDGFSSMFRIGAEQTSTVEPGSRHDEVVFVKHLSFLVFTKRKVQVEECVLAIRPVFKVHGFQCGGDAEVARRLRRHRGSVWPGQPWNRPRL
jgi:hypothetical protein